MERSVFKTPMLILLLVLGATLTYCTKDKTVAPGNNGGNDSSNTSGGICDSLMVSFSSDVAPIFSGNCAVSGCHNSSSAANGIVLETFTQIKDETNNGVVLCAINHDPSCTNMPSGSQQLADSTIQKIECWAKDGYPNN